MKIRFLSVIIALSLIFSCMAMPAFGASDFPDVLSPDHDWAAEQIFEMTELGIIKGYTDGTFKPDKAISKIEALLLFSRVAGYSNENYEACVEFAIDKYQYVLEEIDLEEYNSLKNELAFLIYKGIMDEEELSEYLADDAFRDEFPRQDAAMLIANLMEADVKSVKPSSLEFDDADEISEDYAGYIYYVVENGFMNGVQLPDETVVFDAEKALSRAQVCVLLYRIMDKLNMSVEAGTVTEVDTEAGTIDFVKENGKKESYIVPEDANIIIDGTESKLDKILENAEIVVVRHGKTIYSIEVISPESNIVVKGEVVSIVARNNFIKLVIEDEETGNTLTYYANEAFKVTTDGVADELDSIEIDDYVVVKLLGTEIVSVDRLTEEATVQGIVKNISLKSPITLSVLTTDEISKEENLSEYVVSDSVVIRKNSNAASLREVLVGDEVVITVERGSITKIVATSKKGNVTGTVTAIKIAAQSSLTISANGVEKEYPISMDAQFVIGGSVASIYEVRLGNLVKLSLLGDTATKVEQTATSTSGTKIGVVENVSTSYGYITIVSETEAGVVSEQVFVSKTGSTVNAKIINGETGKELALKNLKEGDNIVATGSYTNGAFVAKTVVVTPQSK